MMGVEVAHQILLNDLGRHANATADDVNQSVGRVLARGWYILGREGESFEKAFAAYCGVAHCVGVANGTDAIELGLRALGVSSGSRVVTVANAGLYTTTALLAIGAEPVFIDVDRSTHLLDIRDLECMLREGPISAVVVTHLFGLLHDMDVLLAVTSRYGVQVFEDCAQAHGAKRNGRSAGSFGAAASFSFYPTKNLGALGDGGAVVTNDDAVAEQVRQLRQYGWDSKYRARRRGGRNSRLDEIQAAVLSTKLPYLDGWNQRRREIAGRYSREIVHPDVHCPPVRDGEFVAHLYVVTSARRDALKAHLAASAITTDIHYPVPDYKQRSLEDLRSWPELPVTSELARTILTLPCYPELTDEEVSRVISCVNAW
jgi:dTDP-4-amino-4,6-dideoxygalactose transaminase